MWISRNSRNRRGGALLAVLWLTAALSVIAFSVAATVRSETERSATLADSIRARYLAQAGIDRALMHTLSLGYGRQPPPRVRFEFPGGAAIVEIIPETARLSLNQGKPEEFLRLLAALGAEPERAQEITLALLDWRGQGVGLDAYYMSLVPSFRPRHASFQEVEEALYLKGMTPDLFHGAHTRDGRGRLVRLGAFKDCVSVFGTSGRFDANYADPALLRSMGIPPETVDSIVGFRRQRPFMNGGEIGPVAGQAASLLRLGGNTIFTFRATARARRGDGRYSDVSRTIAAQIKFRKPDTPPLVHILRWDENAWSEVSQWQ